MEFRERGGAYAMLRAGPLWNRLARIWGRGVESGSNCAVTGSIIC